jgi:hypothetical protein
MQQVSKVIFFLREGKFAARASASAQIRRVKKQLFGSQGYTWANQQI